MFDAKITVFNKYFQAVGIVGVERAITLIYLGKANSIKDSDKVIGSVSMAISIPIAIMVPNMKYVNLKTQLCTKEGVKKRDNFTCLNCGCRDKKKLTIDHYIPQSKFERIKKDQHLDYDMFSWENLICLCRKCNSSKSSHSVEDLGWNIPKPKTPLVNLDINWTEIYGDD